MIRKTAIAGEISCFPAVKKEKSPCGRRKSYIKYPFKRRRNMESPCEFLQNITGCPEKHVLCPPAIEAAGHRRLIAHIIPV